MNDDDYDEDVDDDDIVCVRVYISIFMELGECIYIDLYSHVFMRIH